jgi:dTDP-4-dehydrorhamnose 3,5-epimerase
MKIDNLSYGSKIEDLFILKVDSFSDFRGENFEGYNDNSYQSIFKLSRNWEKQNKSFIIDSYSKSSRGVLRGFHGDLLTWKLIDCLYGSIHFVVIDLREDSPTFGIHQSFNLNEHNKLQVLVPSGCVNAHMCLSDNCLFHYKLTHEYVPQDKQIHVKWNDPKFNVFWPIKDPILSERDK